jgi:phage N-6-adenine-methyltransferase
MPASTPNVERSNGGDSSPAAGYLPFTLQRREHTTAQALRSGGVRPMAIAACLKSMTCEWPTPQWLYDTLDQEFGFTLDVCATAENAKCERHYNADEDGLTKSWRDEVVWMNPPYGRAITAWLEKAWNEAERSTVVCLIPSRTDTAWWHDFVMLGEIRLIRGRIKFDVAKDAPFPSAIVVFRRRSDERTTPTLRSAEPGR